MNIEMHILLWAIIGYLIGSIPTGWILVYLTQSTDIRKSGSGNIGATNVLRTQNKTLALTTLILDIAKGSLSVWLAKTYAPTGAIPLLALAPYIGHLFPIWLNFRGGKGIATYIGILLIISPTILLVFLMTIIVIFIIFNIVSLACLIANITIWIYVIVNSNNSELTLLITCISLLSLFVHRTNIQRILNKTESKINIFKSNR